MDSSEEGQQLQQQKEIGLYLAYGALMTMAFVPIYSGSIASLSGMKRPANASKRKKTDSPLEDSEDEDESITESLSSSDAWMFPVMGSIVLFSLYMLFRYLDPQVLNYLITGYFSLMGCAAVAKTGLMVTKKVIPVKMLKSWVSKYRVTLSREGKRLSHVSFTVIHFILLGASILLTVYYGMTKNWIASNVFGLSFSINAIQLLSLDSFKTGMILLSGLFFYDIFWVFGTEVMVSVAKNFDAPIKVIWPRDIIGYLLSADKSGFGFAMLGLGDIVIPGIFVALCLRFDRHMSWEREPKGEFRSTLFSKPYFTACSFAYILGLATTMVVMHVFHAAQPALLYLSPACILSVLITAAARGELKELFAYTTEEESEEEKKEEKKEENGKKKNKKTKKDKEKESKAEEKAVEKESKAEEKAVEKETKKEADEGVSQVATEEHKADGDDEEEDDYVEVDKSESPKSGKKKKGGKGSRKKK